MSQPPITTIELFEQPKDAPVDAHRSRLPQNSPSAHPPSLDSCGSAVDELRSDPIVLSTKDVQALDVLEHEYFGTKRQSILPPMKTAQSNPPEMLGGFDNQESDPPSDLLEASDFSDTPQQASMKIPIQTRMPRPRLVRGARSISDPFRTMGNKSPRNYLPLDLPPSDPPVESEDDDTPEEVSKTLIQARLRKNCTPTKKAPAFVKMALERRKDLGDSLEDTPKAAEVPRLTLKLKKKNISTEMTTGTQIMQNPQKKESGLMGIPGTEDYPTQTEVAQFPNISAAQLAPAFERPLSGTLGHPQSALPHQFPPALGPEYRRRLDKEALLDAWGFQQMAIPSGPAPAAVQELGTSASGTFQAQAYHNVTAHMHPPLGAEYLFDALPTVGMEDLQDDIPPAISKIIEPFSQVGRPSDEVLGVLDRAFSELNARVKSLAQETGLSVESILTRWNLQTNRAKNVWNMYQRYFKANQEEELGRIGVAVDESLEISQKMKSECMAKFKEEHGDTWEEILHVSNQLQELEDKGTTTLQQRALTWRKSMCKLKDQARTMAERHDFSVMIVAVGNLVHHDRSLMEIYTTPLLTGCLERLCRADDAEFLADVKTYVYEKVSCKKIDGRFKDRNESDIRPKEEESDNADVVKKDNKKDNLSKEVRDMVTRKAAIVKFDPSLGGKFLQWVKLLENMADHCVYLNNYPEPILLPFEQHPTSNKNKGVGNLWLTEQQLLLAAFESCEHPCEFRIYGSGNVDDRLKLQRGEAPIIVFAPPPTSSSHARGKRYFLKNKDEKNSKPRFDRQGHVKCTAHKECIVNLQQYAVLTNMAKSASFLPRGRPMMPALDTEEPTAHAKPAKLNPSRHRIQPKKQLNVEEPASVPATKSKIKPKLYVDVNSDDEFVMESEEESEVLELPAPRTTRAQAKGADTAFAKGKAAARAAPTTGPGAASTMGKAKAVTAPKNHASSGAAKSKAATRVRPTGTKRQRALSTESSQFEDKGNYMTGNDTKRRRPSVHHASDSDDAKYFVNDDTDPCFLGNDTKHRVGRPSIHNDSDDAKYFVNEDTDPHFSGSESHRVQRVRGEAIARGRPPRSKAKDKEEAAALVAPDNGQKAIGITAPSHGARQRSRSRACSTLKNPTNNDNNVTSSRSSTKGGTGSSRNPKTVSFAEVEGPNTRLTVPGTEATLPGNRDPISQPVTRPLPPLPEGAAPPVPLSSDRSTSEPELLEPLALVLGPEGLPPRTPILCNANIAASPAASLPAVIPPVMGSFQDSGGWPHSYDRPQVPVHGQMYNFQPIHSVHRNNPALQYVSQPPYGMALPTVPYASLPQVSFPHQVQQHALGPQQGQYALSHPGQYHHPTLHGYGPFVSSLQQPAAPQSFYGQQDPAAAHEAKGAMGGAGAATSEDLFFHC